MTTLPITVLIPALNAELFIGEAIASVHAQTKAVAEIIVVDNGCVDRTAEIATKLGATVVEAKDRPSISLARNAGLKVCSGKWIALLDADDRWAPEKIEQQWAAIQACPDVGIISCHGLVFENNSVLIESSPEFFQLAWKDYDGRINVDDDISYFPRVERNFFPRFQPSPSTVLLRHDVFSSVGLFDEEVLFCEDIEFFLRVIAMYPLAIVEKTLVQFRRHERKHSFHFQEMRSGLFSVVNKMLKHRERYPDGAPEVYRDLLKKHFFLAERALRDKG